MKILISPSREIDSVPSWSSSSSTRLSVIGILFNTRLLLCMKENSSRPTKRVLSLSEEKANRSCAGAPAESVLTLGILILLLLRDREDHELLYIYE